MLERAKQVAQNLARILDVKRARCFKGCFLGEDGETTLEGNRVLADLRRFAMLGRHSFIRDAEGRLDPLSMARIEGRREVVNRILDHLRLDEQAIQNLVEVTHEH